jgi:hypothetical protein
LNEKFSITVDEWTDISMKRYINVTLHHNNVCYRLGLLKIGGSCDAFKTTELVEQKLAEFGLTFKDVVASTHDGAAVMQKYGRIISSESQLRHNHGIHLAITDVLYKKVRAGEGETNNDETCDNDSDEDSDEYDFDDIIEEEFPKNKTKIGSALDMSRKLIKFFKRSTVRDPILQKHVLEYLKKELKLILDVKTRWNSLVPNMIERLLKLKPCIKKALADIGTNNFYDEENFKILEDVLKVLKPTELAVKELSKDQRRFNSFDQ